MPRKAKAGKTKLKTHKATSKRFRLTGSGKVVRTKGGKSHLRRNTSKRTKAQLSEMQTV
jgi:large subunit ribosomal protein L35